MQTKNLCFIYPWATLGGVERVLLNRALAFKQYLPSIKVDFFFLHDSGGLRPMSSAIEEYGLTNQASIASSLTHSYDLAFAIDCPQAISLCEQRSQRYVVECHTAYTENRTYLKKIPKSCERIITPSTAFSDALKIEYPSLASRITELRNFVPWDVEPTDTSPRAYLPKWTRKPILFFGRLDKLKDPLSLLDAFETLNKVHKHKYMLLLCGPRSPEIDIPKEIKRRSLEQCTVFLPAVPFAAARRLFEAVSEASGIFVSPSKGESFGLSAAEAISSLVPVVLSNIPAHANLVHGYEMQLTYPLGKADILAERIIDVFERYHDVRKIMGSLRNKFSAKSFIEDWNLLFRELHIT